MQGSLSDTTKTTYTTASNNFHMKESIDDVNMDENENSSNPVSDEEDIELTKPNSLVGGSELTPPLKCCPLGQHMVPHYHINLCL